MPLPKPYRNEDEDNFIQRCVIHPQVVNDFEGAEQRVAVCYDLYERKESKSKIKYEKDYLRQLSIAVNLQTLKMRKYYEREYKKAVEHIVEYGEVGNMQSLFKLNEIKELYVDTYQNIGVRFAKWYAKNYKKYINKNQRLKAYEEVWKEVFAANGAKVGAALAPIVQGTARSEFQRLFKKLMTDEQFARENMVIKARILNKQFPSLAGWQSLRVIKTEGNYVANLGVNESAKTFFGENGTNKVWNCNFNNSRDWHIAAHEQKVGFNEKFIVDGEPMTMPGDPSASGANRINCNCYVTYEPKPGAQAITDLTGIGVGLAAQTVIETITEIEELEN